VPSRKGLRGYEFLDGVHIYRHPRPRGKRGLGILREYTSALFWSFVLVVIYLRRGFHVIQAAILRRHFPGGAAFKLLGVKYIFDHTM